MDVEQDLLPLLKQLAEGVLKQRIVIDELRGRLERLEHVMTVNAVSQVVTPPSIKDTFYAHRDIIGN